LRALLRQRLFCLAPLRFAGPHLLPAIRLCGQVPRPFDFTAH
jgi:hypothetical protein